MLTSPWIVLLMLFQRFPIIIQENNNFVKTSGVLPTVFDWGISSTSSFLPVVILWQHMIHVFPPFTAGHLPLPITRPFPVPAGKPRFPAATVEVTRWPISPSVPHCRFGKATVHQLSSAGPRSRYQESNVNLSRVYTLKKTLQSRCEIWFITYIMPVFEHSKGMKKAFGWRKLDLVD